MSLLVVRSQLPRAGPLVSVKLFPDEVFDFLPERRSPQLLPQAEYSSQDIILVQYTVAHCTI
uniref:Uncharacterized protein n=1 Tax=Arundo donax TaxID=35708 RepID=A0A0A9DFQ0_ARUDO